MAEAYTGADLFVDALERYGVTRLFGNPGTTELPVMRALEGSDVEYVLGLHEDVAVGMASGYASTRRYHAHDDPSITPAGVVNLHVAPGVAHGLGNLFAASYSGTPLVVTAGNHGTDYRHEEPIISGDVVPMVEGYTKRADEVLDVAALPTMLRRAFRVALTPPTGPVFLALPLDVLRAPTDDEPERLGPIPDAGRGDGAQVERAADLLADADEPVLVVGDHVARSGVDAVEAAVDLAEAAGARVHAEILGCEVNFPSGHDLWASHLPPDAEVVGPLLDVDTIAFVGCSTNTTYMPRERPLVPDGATCIHVSDDAWEVGKNQPADAAVIGDPGSVMAQLAERVRGRVGDGERAARRERAAAVIDRLDERRSAGADGADDPRPSNVELVDAMRSVAPDAYIVDEGVTAKYALLTRWPFEPEGYVSNKSGALGYGLPAAVGAAMAEAERDSPRDVIGFVGDGSFLYYPHALHSAARHGVDLTVVIPDNRGYRILKDNALDMFGGDEGDHEFIGTDIDPAVDLPANAESYGADARLVEDADAIEDALAAALDTAGPAVLDVLVRE